MWDDVVFSNFPIFHSPIGSFEKPARWEADVQFRAGMTIMPKMVIEIVDFPINSMVMLHGFLSVCQRVYTMLLDHITYEIIMGSKSISISINDVCRVLNDLPWAGKKLPLEVYHWVCHIRRYSKETQPKYNTSSGPISAKISGWDSSWFQEIPTDAQHVFAALFRTGCDWSYATSPETREISPAGSFLHPCTFWTLPHAVALVQFCSVHLGFQQFKWCRLSCFWQPSNLLEDVLLRSADTKDVQKWHGSSAE